MKVAIVEYEGEQYELVGGDAMRSELKSTGSKTIEVAASATQMLGWRTMCDCCSLWEAEFHHDRPDAGGVYDYCDKCNDAGCGDPAETCTYLAEQEVLESIKEASMPTSEELDAEFLALMANSPTIQTPVETEQTTPVPPPAAVDPADLVRQLAQGIDFSKAFNQPTVVKDLIAEKIEEAQEKEAEQQEGEAYLTSGAGAPPTESELEYLRAMGLVPAENVVTEVVANPEKERYGDGEPMFTNKVEVEVNLDVDTSDEKFWPAAVKVQALIDNNELAAAYVGIQALALAVMPDVAEAMLAEIDGVMQEVAEENHVEFLNHVLSSIVDYRSGNGDKAMDEMGQALNQPEQYIQEGSFQEILADVDPRDSEAALFMLDWLLRTGRLYRVGVLDGGQGYLFGYHEPKGTTKAGYKPGGTQGDRIVDAAVDAQRATGQRPAKRGMCPQCMSAVRDTEDGSIVLDDPENPTLVCSGGDGGHLMV